MAWTTINAGDDLNSAKMTIVISELYTAYNERRFVIGRSSTSAPTDSDITDRGKAAISFLQSAIYSNLCVPFGNANSHGFMKLDETAWADEDALLAAAGHGGGWITGTSANLRTIWTQLQDVFDEIKVYRTEITFALTRVIEPGSVWGKGKDSEVDQAGWERAWDDGVAGLDEWSGIGVYAPTWPEMAGWEMIKGVTPSNSYSEILGPEVSLELDCTTEKGTFMGFAFARLYGREPVGMTGDIYVTLRAQPSGEALISSVVIPTPGNSAHMIITSGLECGVVNRLVWEFDSTPANAPFDLPDPGDTDRRILVMTVDDVRGDLSAPSNKFFRANIETSLSFG